MKNEDPKEPVQSEVAVRYRVAEGLTAVAMMVMIVVMAGLGTMIVGR